MGGVISVFKSKTLRLHTTRSWDFMGLTLNDGELRLAPLQWAYGGDIVIGVFDTGLLVHTLLSLSPLLHQFYSCTSSCFILPTSLRGFLEYIKEEPLYDPGLLFCAFHEVSSHTTIP